MPGARKPPAAAEEKSEPETPHQEQAKDPGPRIEPCLTIHEALSRVMGDVQSISKDSRNQSQNFNFRGIDAVLNAVGPALRKWGVIVVPVKVKAESENYQTKSGTAMKNVTLTVTFRFYGPGGDWITAQARGEAADSGDKATPKAHSVALRTALLQALCIPTDEPDPDESSHERVHESGFQRGSRPDDMRARPQSERRQETTTYNWPKDLKELAERMYAHVGPAEGAEWMKQAVKVATGDHEHRYSELPVEQQKIAWDVLTKALRDIEDEGELQLHPTPRETISAIFAKHLDGQILNGPTWALTGAEAEKGYPAREEVIAAEPSESASDDVAKQEDDVPPEQATLDAEAAAAAEAAE